MKNVHPAVAQAFHLPSTPPPVTTKQLQSLHAKAFAEVYAMEAADHRYSRALQDQQQQLQNTGGMA